MLLLPGWRDSDLRPPGYALNHATPADFTGEIKLQRHYKVRVVLFSQTFDIDKKLRADR